MVNSRDNPPLRPDPAAAVAVYLIFTWSSSPLSPQTSRLTRPSLALRFHFILVYHPLRLIQLAFHYAFLLSGFPLRVSVLLPRHQKLITNSNV